MAVLAVPTLSQGDVCAHHTSNGCSVPLGAPFFYKEHFNSSCNRHDVCYGCGAGYGVNRELCDAAFLEDMKFACTSLNLSPSPRRRRSVSRRSTHRGKRTICAWFADQYYWAVRSFAEFHFYDVHQIQPYCQESWVKTCLPDPRFQPVQPAQPGQPNQPGSPQGSTRQTDLSPSHPSVLRLIGQVGSELRKSLAQTHQQAGHAPGQQGQPSAQPNQPSGQPGQPTQQQSQPSFMGLLGQIGSQLSQSLAQPGQAGQPNGQPAVRSSQPQNQPSVLGLLGQISRHLQQPNQQHNQPGTPGQPGQPRGQADPPRSQPSILGLLGQVASQFG